MKLSIKHLVLSGLMISLTWGLEAQQGPQHQPHTTERQNLKAELRELRKETFGPKFKTLRQEFWQALPQNEQTFLSEQKAKAQQLRQLRHENRQAVIAWKKDNPQTSQLPPELYNRYETLKKEEQNFIQAMQAFHQRNANLSQATKQTWQELNQAWRETVRNKYQETQIQHHPKRKYHHHKGEWKNRYLTRFDAFVLKAVPTTTQAPQAQVQNNLTNLKLFPNPMSGGALQIAFDLNQDLRQGFLQIVSEEGLIIGQYPLKALPAGQHQISWALPQLQGPRYYLIQVLEGTQILSSGRFLKP